MAAGIYIHIPFCKSRCSYCDFATDVYRDEDSVERYVRAVVRETEIGVLAHHQVDAGPGQVKNSQALVFDSVYFGGGTPSLLNPRQLDQILNSVTERFDVGADPEITVEMNPATVSIDRLRDFRSLGVNRASFGVQTFDNRSLKLLARGHDADDARRTYDLLRSAGFSNVSFDLIAGLPHQTLADWTSNLDEAVRMSPEHISLYLLEIHEGTPLAEQVRSGRQPVPDEDTAAEMYETMLQRLGDAGYVQYEISNFCREGFESRHNLKYWELDPVIGFGVSAHSFDGQRRWVNVRDTLAYVRTVECGDSPVVENSVLSAEQLKAEYAFLKLRLNKGLDLAEYAGRFGTDLMEEFGEKLLEFRDIGLLEISEGGRISLTEKGRLFSNEVFGVFV